MWLVFIIITIIIANCLIYVIPLFRYGPLRVLPFCIGLSDAARVLFGWAVRKRRDQNNGMTKKDELS